MIMRNLVFYTWIGLILIGAGCSKDDEEENGGLPPPRPQGQELKRLPIDNLEGIITTSGVELDKQVSSDGNGSLKITAKRATVVKLYEVRGLDIENAQLIYQAKARTQDLQGKAYLEMRVHFPGRGEFFSRGLARPITGTSDWKTIETPFMLKEGQNPDRLRLNLSITGKGTVWIDDIRLLKLPPK
jgi:hypothetical protein